MRTEKNGVHFFFLSPFLWPGMEFNVLVERIAVKLRVLAVDE